MTSFNDIATFRRWLRALASVNFKVQFDSTDSAIFAVEIDGVLQGFSFRVFPSVDDVVIRFWSGRCYFVSSESFACFITELPRTDPLLLKTTHFELPINMVIQYSFNLCHEFYLSQQTEVDQLDDIDFSAVGPLTITEVRETFPHAMVSGDLKFCEVICEGNRSRFVECDDGLVQFFCEGENLRSFGLHKSSLSLFDAFGNRLRDQRKCEEPA